MAAAFLLVHTHLFSGNADVQYPSELGKFSYRVCCRTASDGCGTGAVHSPCRNAGLVETEDGNNGGIPSVEVYMTKMIAKSASRFRAALLI